MQISPSPVLLSVTNSHDHHTVLGAHTQLHTLAARISQARNLPPTSRYHGNTPVPKIKKLSGQSIIIISLVTDLISESVDIDTAIWHTIPCIQLQYRKAGLISFWWFAQYTRISRLATEDFIKDHLGLYCKWQPHCSKGWPLSAMDASLGPLQRASPCGRCPFLRGSHSHWATINAATTHSNWRSS